jgi:hypothetical protein
LTGRAEEARLLAGAAVRAGWGFGRVGGIAGRWRHCRESLVQGRGRVRGGPQVAAKMDVVARDSVAAGLPLVEPTNPLRTELDDSVAGDRLAAKKLVPE